MGKLSAAGDLPRAQGNPLSPVRDVLGISVVEIGVHGLQRDEAIVREALDTLRESELLQL